MGCAIFIALISGACKEVWGASPDPVPPPIAEIPYQVDGLIYYPQKNIDNFDQAGIASWYGPSFHGQLTSNKEVYDMNGMTAAHKTLPFNTLVKVVNLENGAETVVRINDRGPFSKRRIIDLSYGAAKSLGLIGNGTANVRLIALPNKDAANNLETREAYTVQVAVFKSSNSAHKAGGGLENGKVKPFYQHGSQYYRVMVGSFTAFDEALKTRDEMRKQGYPKAYIIPDN